MSRSNEIYMMESESGSKTYYRDCFGQPSWPSPYQRAVNFMERHKDRKLKLYGENPRRYVRNGVESPRWYLIRQQG